MSFSWIRLKAWMVRESLWLSPLLIVGVMVWGEFFYLPAQRAIERPAPRAPCYPVEALAPAVAHEIAQRLHTSVEALMGVEKCP